MPSKIINTRIEYHVLIKVCNLLIKRYTILRYKLLQIQRYIVCNNIILPIKNNYIIIFKSKTTEAITNNINKSAFRVLKSLS